MNLPKEKIKKILIIRPDAIGDLVLITPAISALRKSFPQAHIAILLQAYAAPVMEFNPDINEIIIDKIKGNEIKGIGDYLKYVAEIKARHFDLSVDFYSFHWKHTLLQFLAGIPYRLGDKSRLLLSPFYNLGKVLKYKDYTKHIVDLHLDLLKTIGIEESQPRLKLIVPEKIQQDFAEKLKALGINQSDFLVGVHPGCISSRAWDEDKFAKVIDGLYEQFNAKVVLTGGSKEQEKGDRISNLCQHPPINLIAKTTLPEMMALIKRLNIYIGADTGPTHVAGALGTPVLLIILAKNVKPVRWASYNSPHMIIYAHPRAQCAIFCDAGSCQEVFCSQVISPAEVLAGVQYLREGKSFQKSDWEKLSFNTLLIFDAERQTLAESISKELKNKGYYAVLFKAEEIRGLKGIKTLLKIIETENILILHHLGTKAYLWTRLANLLSGIYTTNATILVKGYVDKQDILSQYNSAFQKSLF